MKNNLEPWNCHEHKNEMFISNNVVCHPEHGQLCIQSTTLIFGGKYMISEAVEFTTEEDAQEWIDNGSIEELQENLNCLHIGFTNVMVQHSPSFTEFS